MGQTVDFLEMIESAAGVSLPGYGRMRMNGGVLQQSIDGAAWAAFGGGGGTVTVGAGLSGDGSSGNPLVNTAPFGADTTILLPNSTPANVSAWEGVASLTTATAGSEVSQYLIKLLDGASANHQVTAMTIGPRQTLFPTNTDQRTPGVAMAGHASTGLTWLASGSLSTEVLGLAVGNTTPSLPNFQFDSSGTLVLSGGGGGARVYFGSALDMVIGKFGSATTLTINNSNGAGTIVNQIGGVTALEIDHNLNAKLGKTAPGTTATNGFACIPACAGPPTGAFTPPAGFAGLVADNVNGKAYLNTAGTWIALN